jgi:hypothetical protein
MREKYEKEMKRFSAATDLYSAWLKSYLNFQNVYSQENRKATGEPNQRAIGEQVMDLWNAKHKMRLENKVAIITGAGSGIGST